MHDFSDPDWGTRFLGDLYQDLSEAARKKYALLQTPDFVEEFILDRTLELALDEFGLQPETAENNLFKMIDPACGSGHFLLGSFPRILSRWQKEEPGTNIRVLVQRTLDSIHGVDINPFAIAIARIRLLLAALAACGVKRLADAPAFGMKLACGDSLYHGRQRQQTLGDWTDESHYFQTEDADSLRHILQEGTFHAVVANPPYITPKDKAANDAYRQLYSSCHMKYSLAAPFMERIFRLAASKDRHRAGAGFTGQITANSFMKREFGKKLIEHFLPTVELSCVIDASGAFIPGHATPTVIVFGRNRLPTSSVIRTVMGICGEPATPETPEQGLVWSAMMQQIDEPGSSSEYVSVVDNDVDKFHSHPWSVGGGGVAELKEELDQIGITTLADVSASIGPPSFAGVDDMFYSTRNALRTRGVPDLLIRDLCKGDVVRDWQVLPDTSCLVPYDQQHELLEFDEEAPWGRFLWPCRSCSKGMLSFAKQTRSERGEPWWSWYRWIKDRYRTSARIPYALLSSHNHFVITDRRLVFNGSAPVVCLAEDSTPEEQAALLGLLNSSLVGFWMKQVGQRKQLTAGDGVRIESLAKVPFEFGATQLSKLPIPAQWTSGPLREQLIRQTQRMQLLIAEAANATPERAIGSGPLNSAEIAQRIKSAASTRRRLRSAMVIAQEEIDYIVYAIYGIAGDDDLRSDQELDIYLTSVDAGARPFEIFKQHSDDGFSVPCSVPEEFPEEIARVWENRIAAIKSDKSLRLLEDAAYKRRWIGLQGKYNKKRDRDPVEEACESWLLRALESYFDVDGRLNDEGKATAQIDISLISVAKLADIARQDEQFMEVAEVYRDDPAFDVQKLVEELVKGEHVPLLPVLRYKPSGLRNRAEWERTWELQRLEDKLRAGEDVRLSDYELTDQQRDDIAEWQQSTPENQRADDRALDAILSIPVPPKYKSSDFISSGGARYWALRGKLDVPKERWISFPHCHAEDGSLTLCWAGYDHLQQATAISAWYVDIRDRQGGIEDPRLIPLLESGEITSLFTIVGHRDPNRVGITAPLAPWSERDRSQAEIMSEVAQTLTDIPGPVDFVLVAVPAPAVIDVMHQAIAKKAKCVMIFSSGFAEAGEAYAKWFHKRLIKLEERLATREFLCADRFTVADICCGYALILAKSVGLDEGVPDSLKAYRARLTEREGYKRAFAREEAGRKALEEAAG